MLKASGELGAWERCSVWKSCAPATTWEVQFELTEVNTRSSYKRRNATASILPSLLAGGRVSMPIQAARDSCIKCKTDLRLFSLTTGDNHPVTVTHPWLRSGKRKRESVWGEGHNTVQHRNAGPSRCVLSTTPPHPMSSGNPLDLWASISVSIFLRVLSRSPSGFVGFLLQRPSWCTQYGC